MGTPDVLPSPSPYDPSFGPTTPLGVEEDDRPTADVLARQILGDREEEEDVGGTPIPVSRGRDIEAAERKGVAGSVADVSEKRVLSARDIGIQARIEAITASITPGNAKEMLAEIKRMPKKFNTFVPRLLCMQADSEIETWDALTYPPTADIRARMGHGEKALRFKQYMGGPGIWIPEVERINLKVMENMFVELGRTFAEGDLDTEAGIGSFVRKMKHPDEAEKKGLTVARGAPSAGKTTFLRGNFALACDQVKIAILNNFRGLTPQQTHHQSAMIIEKFRTAVKEYFTQDFTVDALYLTPDGVEAKLDAAAKSGQRVNVHDIQVDMRTLCCRLLKRSEYEPRMPFNFIAKCYRWSAQNRQETLDLVMTRKEHVGEFSINVWEGDHFEEIAALDQDSRELAIKNPAKFRQYVTEPDAAATEREIEALRGEVITEAFIAEFTRGMPTSIAKDFREALKRHVGKTFEAAVNEHSQAPIRELSVGARVVTGSIDALSDRRDRPRGGDAAPPTERGRAG